MVSKYKMFLIEKFYQMFFFFFFFFYNKAKMKYMWFMFHAKKI